MVTPMPPHFAQYFEEQKQLVFLPLNVPIYVPPVCMVLNSDVLTSPVVNKFKHILWQSVGLTVDVGAGQDFLGSGAMGGTPIIFGL